MKRTTVYIAGFRQHAGKTVTGLGIIHLLKKRFPISDIGYIKPVGQEVVEVVDGKIVDKDAVIIQKFSGIPDLNMDHVSPVRLGSGFTRSFLSSPNPGDETKKLRKTITDAFMSLVKKRIIIAEGTGHPGVGSIVGCSNADVCNLLDADIVYLSGGGIGKALDSLEVDLSYFIRKKCRVRGIIFNKLIPSKIETIKKYVTEDLINQRFAGQYPIRIFGYLPEIDDLSKPAMRVIANNFRNALILGDPENERWKTPCSGIRVIALNWRDVKPDKYLDSGKIIILGVTAVKSIERILRYYKQHRKSSPQEADLAGLILTCGDTNRLDPKVEKHIRETGIPALLVKDDTASAEQKILEIFDSTKLQPFDSHKIDEINDLFENHFDSESFLRTFGINVNSGTSGAT